MAYFKSRFNKQKGVALTLAALFAFSTVIPTLASPVFAEEYTTMTFASSVNEAKAFPQSGKWKYYGNTPSYYGWTSPVTGGPGYYATIKYSKSTMDNAVLEYFKQWKDNFYAEYTTDDDNNPVGVILGPVTGGTEEEEGQWKNCKMVSASEHTGYGMILFALMAGYPGDNGQCKQDFDSLVRLYLGLKRPNNLMGWIVPEDTNLFKNALTDDNVGDLPGSATDGDFDIAYALLLAEKQWPNDNTFGKTYKELALDMIDNGIYNDLISSQTNRILLGDWHSEGIREKWLPNLLFNPYLTRCSDFMIENLRAFGAVSPTKKSRFDAAINECYNIMAKFKADKTNGNNGTGLLPDFIINNYTYKKNSSGNYVKDKEGNKVAVFTSDIVSAPQDVYDALGENFPEKAYSENACRLPQRLALDFIHTNNANDKLTLTDMSNWINPKVRVPNPHGPSSNDWSRVKDGYWINGTDMDWGDNHLGTHTGTASLQFTSGLISSNVANNALALGSGFNYLSATHSYGEPDETDAYFKDTLALFNLLIMSGNWWSPANAR